LSQANYCSNPFEVVNREPTMASTIDNPSKGLDVGQFKTRIYRRCPS